MGGSCQFSNGAYIAREPKLSVPFNCFSTITPFSNFIFEAHMTITQGDCGGMSFRTDVSGSKFYYFNVCQTGLYSLTRFNGVGILPQQVTDNSMTSLIHPDLNQSNLIAIVARGSTITLYANCHELVTVQDTGYASGKIAIAAGSVTHPTEVIYSNVRVWTF